MLKSRFSLWSLGPLGDLNVADEGDDAQRELQCFSASRLRSQPPHLVPVTDDGADQMPDIEAMPRLMVEMRDAAYREVADAVTNGVCAEQTVIMIVEASERIE